MIVFEPFDVYKAKKNYINPSSFKGEKYETPAKFEYEFNHGVKKEAQFLKVGTAFHCMVLTPELFDKEYYVSNQKDFPGKRNMDGAPSMADAQNKASISILQAENPDKIILLPNEAELLDGMFKGLNRFLHPEWRWIFSKKGFAEVSIYMEAEFDDKFNFCQFVPESNSKEIYHYEEKDGKVYHYLKVKTRSDHFTPHKGIASDLKTCESAEPTNFSKDSYTYGYFPQAAFTLDMLNAHYSYPEQVPAQIEFARGENGFNSFYFVAVEKEPPFQAALYECSQDFIHKGQDNYQNRLSWICKGYAYQSWPGYEIYSDSIEFNEDGDILKNYKTIVLDLPFWANSKEERKKKHQYLRGF